MSTPLPVHLQNALAYEADVVDAHLSYQTFPKTRRKIAGEQAARLRALARGSWPEHYDVHPRSVASAGQELRESLPEAERALYAMQRLQEWSQNTKALASASDYDHGYLRAQTEVRAILEQVGIENPS